jgi:hypothetical protein
MRIVPPYRRLRWVKVIVAPGRLTMFSNPTAMATIPPTMPTCP